MKNSTTFKQFKDLDSYQIIKSGSELNINYYSGSIYPISNGANININGDVNINTYEFLINGLYYGNDITTLPAGMIQINTNDILTINIVKTNNAQSSSFNLVSTIV